MYQLTILVFFGWLLSLCLHEFGHAIVAYWGGDTSVKEKGYLTLNPLKYIHPVYSLAMPMIFLMIGGIGLPGAAVYINDSQIRSRFWLSLTSLAGPLASCVATIILVVIYKVAVGQLPQENFIQLSQLEYVHQLQDNVSLNFQTAFISKYWFVLGLSVLIYLQVFGVIFNLLPVPTLDGYGVIEPWMTEEWKRKLQPFKQYAFPLLLGLFWFSPAFSQKISGWCYQLTRLLDVDLEYVREGFVLFQQASTPLVVGAFIVFVIVRRITVKKHEALYKSALADRRTGKLVVALKNLEKAIALQPDFPKALLLKADILFAQQNYAEAVSIWEQHPQDLWIQQNFIVALWNLNRLQEALDLSDRILSEDPNNTYVGQLKAAILKDLNHPEEALAACDRILALEPHIIYLWQLKGEILWQQKSLEAALKSYQKIAELDKRSISAWISQSKILTELNRLEEALECGDRVLQIDPRDPDFLHNCGYILCLLRQFDEAILCFDRILKKYPKYVNAYYNRACCYAEKNQVSLAISNLKSALEYGDRDLKEQARTDDSFANIRDALEFQQLMV
ncbi:hypothetical protein TUMEXPCC7403_14735 [Tumidithrix helvetica PCC 7403]|uniref:tetratricopeptide repeat protein n=1 Tax=Tumidithrix helvetica TaxID=3457545 RepID=UPI003C874A56